ncbi:hypothetical protein DLAC_09636 [Tieghemostelium lacteum]|uniref:Uncharacterized protein n=1 Tax=Tieghemostelium lacteum TaxID=361077 RepID=A0A151Z6T3_TIELA|nr:hypothetical protein DLAC_09636 [Tieghemostelium lacteum]|eukprot:KYQ89670.1 hypothetical protein DLAC_09636 [Tieghemostelium lacteum]
MNFYSVCYNGNFDTVNIDGDLCFSQYIDKIRERPQLGVPNQRVNLYFTINIDDVNNNNFGAMELLNPIGNMWIDGHLVHPGGLNSYIYVLLNPIVPVQPQAPVGLVRVFVRGKGVAHRLFAAGCSWETVARSLHLSQGGQTDMAVMKLGL